MAAGKFGMNTARLVVTREPSKRLASEAHQRRAHRWPMAGIVEQPSDEVLGEALRIGGHAGTGEPVIAMSVRRTAMA